MRNKIKIIRNKQRDGLVRSRLRGAAMSNGEVLTFLDSHCEATKGWIEPLLQRIKEDRRNVVCPVIEVIDAVDFSYKGSTLKAVTQVGSFTWDLFFTWKELSTEQRNHRKDETDPLRLVPGALQGGRAGRDVCNEIHQIECRLLPSQIIVFQPDP